MSHRYQQRQAVKNKSKYLDWLVQSKCGADLLAAQLFPNAKEVTESVACFEATIHLNPGFEWNSPNVQCFVVGDGHKPRTAAVFACRTAWNVFSIDPVLAPRIYNIKRLNIFRKKIEDLKFVDLGSPVLIVLPHSHAPLDACLANIPGAKRALITLDCCKKQDPGPPADIEYVDENVWSPKNTVRVWQSI